MIQSRRWWRRIGEPSWEVFREAFAPAGVTGSVMYAQFAVRLAIWAFLSTGATAPRSAIHTDPV